MTVIVRLATACALLGCAEVDAPPAPTEWRVVRAFGVADTPGNQAIGEVTDVASSPGGSLALLDARNRRVSLLSARGELVAQYERAGSGPGEFDVPAALVFLNDSLLVVADRANRRLTALVIHSDTLLYQWDATIEHESRDMCAMHDHVVILGDYEGRLLHFYSLDGQYIRSTTRPTGPVDAFPDEDPNRARLLGTGLLLCDELRGRIVFAVSHFGRIRVLDHAGQDLAAISLPAFVAVSVEPSGRGGVSWKYPEGADAIDRIIGVAEAMGFYWIQLTREYDPSRFPDRRIEYLTSTVEVVSLTAVPATPMPFLDGLWAAGSGLVTARSDPFPQVLFATAK